MSFVILVSLDGVRPDSLTQANCPNLDWFKHRSSFTMQASSVMPSITLPCHTSVFHSVPPTRHDITTNEWQPMARPLPGLIEVAHQAGKKCAFFYNWEQLRDLSRPGHLEVSFFHNSGENNGRIDHTADDPIVETAIQVLTQQPFDFAFVYFGSVDIAGHAYGWMSDGYLAQLERVDAAFGKLMNALPAESTILVQSDHGGHERGHGTNLPEDMTIPWMIAGPGIRSNYEIETADTSSADTSSSGTSFSMVASTGQTTLTIIITRRGRFR